MSKFLDENGLNILVKKLPFIYGNNTSCVKQNNNNCNTYGNYSASFNYKTHSNIMGYTFDTILVVEDSNGVCGELFLNRNTDNSFHGPLNWYDSTESDKYLDTTFPTPAYSIGDYFCIVTADDHIDCEAKITAINNNHIAFSCDSNRVNRFKKIQASITKTDNGFDAFTFYVPTKPNIGIRSCTQYSFAANRESVAAGNYAFVAGRSNYATGDGSAVFGRGSEAGYVSFTAGYQNKALGDRCAAFGANVSVYGGQAFGAGNGNTIKTAAQMSAVFGQGNTVNNRSSFILGRCNSTNAEDQVIVGAGASVTSDTVFAVGNAKITVDSKNASSINGARSNAFTVYKDGRAAAGRATQPTDSDNTLTTKGYINLSLTDKVDKVVGKGLSTNDFTDTYKGKLDSLPPLTKGSESNTVQQTSSKALVSNSVALLGGTTNSTYGGGPQMAIGEQALSDAQYGVAIGRSAEVHAQHGVAIGLSTKTNTRGIQYTLKSDGTKSYVNQNRQQIVLGCFNEVLPGICSSGSTRAYDVDKSEWDRDPDSDTYGLNTKAVYTDAAVFMVGVGSGDSARKNGLVVWGDGKVTGGKQTEVNDSDNTLVTKSYIDNLMADLLTDLNDGGIV